MKHLDLFSGIGGFALACEWVGIETIGFVEIEPFCQKVLKKHWPNVPLVGDIKDVKEDTFPQPITILTGGFPCQPFSIATSDRRRGKNDDRYLWPEMLRVIKEYRPTWILGENVAGISSMVQPTNNTEMDNETIEEDKEGEDKDKGLVILDEICESIEHIGYSVQPFLISAASVGADHLRYRIWIIAHSNNSREGTQQYNNNRERSQIDQEQAINSQSQHNRHFKVASNPNGFIGSFGIFNRDGNKEEGWDKGTQIRSKDRKFSKMGCDFNREFFKQGREFSKPRLVRINDGLSPELDRIRCLGNAIVPQVAYEILKGIVEIESKGINAYE